MTAADDDRWRKKRILEIILIGSIATLVVLDGTVLAYSLHDGTSYQGISFPLFSILPVFFAFLYALSRRGFSALSSYLLIAIYMICNSYAAYRWGVNLHVALITYALIIVTATILRGPRFGFFITGAISMFILPLWYVQFHGIIPVASREKRDADAFVFAILYFLIMIVAWLYDREIELSLARAQESERALKEERNLLEVNIARRTEELRIAQLEKIEQLGRFAELGQLSSGLFHDVFNLLNAISLRSDDPSDPSLANAYNTTQQIQGFVQAVRNQIDHRDDKVEFFSVCEYVDCALQLVSYKANQNHIRISFDRRDNDMRCFNAPLKFHRVVVNLLLNAVESFDNLPGNDKRKRTIKILIENDHVHHQAILHIADNGAGMHPDVERKIFEPFFTTKERSKGMGIGLAMAKKIVEKDFCGTIAVRSTEGVGTRFIVRIPLGHVDPSNTPAGSLL